MSRPAKIPSAGIRKQVPIKLASEEAVDLLAFCEAHYGARQNIVIGEALRRFIHEELAKDPPLKSRFDGAKERILRTQEALQGDALRLVRPKPEKDH